MDRDAPSGYIQEEHSFTICIVLIDHDGQYGLIGTFQLELYTFIWVYFTYDSSVRTT